MLSVVRDGAHAALVAELRALAKTHRALSVHVVFTRPREEDRLGIDHDHVGRPDTALLTLWLKEPDVDVRLCGPSLFVADVAALLAGIGTPEQRIVSESF